MFADFVKRQTAVLERTSVPRGAALRVVRRDRGPVRVVDERVIVHAEPSLRARVLSRGLRLVIKPTLALMPFNDRSIHLMRSIDARAARRPRSRHVEPFEYRLGGVRVEQMSHRYGPDSDMTVLYFHGGGFFSCGIETHRRVCERLALATGGAVISVDYVQLPEGTVADSVQDAINAYQALLEQVAHPDKIVVAGDSAGGYLSMKVAELAVRRGLQPPAAVIGFSPLLSLDPDAVDKGIQQVSRMNDAYLPLRRLKTVRRRWLTEENVIEGCESPLDAAGLIRSPTFLVAVEDEILRPEVEAMALRLSAGGVEVETHLWRGLIHAFPVLTDPLPESREAVRLAGRFARMAVGESVPEETVTAGRGVVSEPLVGELVPEGHEHEPAVIDGVVVGERAQPGPTPSTTVPGPERPWWRRWFSRR